MLMLLALLTLVLVAMRMAADPENWAWLFGGQKAAQQDDSTQERPGDRKETEEPPLGPGEVRIEPDTDGDRPDDRTDRTDASSSETPDDAAAARSLTGPDHVIDGRILEPVEDGTTGVRYDEAEAYFRILAHVRRLPRRELRGASRDDVAFSVLMASPAHYRGQPITIEGRLHGLRKFTESENEQGVVELYEAWITTPESSRTPYRVVLSEPPDEIAPADAYDEPAPVRATGYFFKLQAYEIDGGESTAPLLLARTIDLLPRQPAGRTGAGLTPYLIVFFALIGLSVAVAAWRAFVGDRAFERRHLKRLSEAPREDIQALEGVEQTDPNEIFRQLAAEDNASDPAADDADASNDNRV